MSERPRQNAQASRLARRQSPYTRVSAPSTPAPSTPSRLRTLLSYVSPFRSARKPADATTPAIESRPNNDGRGGEVAASTATESDDRDADAPQASSSGASRSVNTPLALRLNVENHGNATADLARFFQDKARAGGAPLTPIERAGVLQLLQQGAESQTPTAFTPNFRPQAGPSDASAPNPPTSTGPSDPLPSTTRRRPLYVGAGYTARRRRQARQATADEGDSLAAAMAPAGKRRRVVEDADRLAAGVSHSRASPLSGTLASMTSASAPAPRGLDAAGQRNDASRPSAARSEASPKRVTSRAADLMLDIIRSEESGSLRSSGRQAVRPADTARILNPYDTEEDPLSFVSRSPRSSVPVKPPTPAAKQPQTQARPAEPVRALEKPAPKPATPIEILQRTMPAEYRREAMKPAVKSRQPSPPRQTIKPPAPKASKPDTIELLSSSDEDEQGEDDVSEEGDGQEDDEMMTEEDEAATEEDELDAQSDEGDADSVDMATDDAEAAGETTRSGTEEVATESDGEPEIMVVHSDDQEESPAPVQQPASSRPQPAFSFGAAPTAKPTPFSFALAPSTAPSTSTRPAPSAAPASVTFDAPVDTTVENSVSRACATEGPEDSVAAREAALQLGKAQLPLSLFNFTAAYPPSQVDLATTSIAELARNMNRSELPSFSF